MFEWKAFSGQTDPGPGETIAVFARGYKYLMTEALVRIVCIYVCRQKKGGGDKKRRGKIRKRTGELG